MGEVRRFAGYAVLLAAAAALSCAGAASARAPRYVGVAAGNGFGCGLTAGHDVHCWGYNFYGSLGAPTRFVQSDTPVTVRGVHGVTALSAEAERACALTRAGAVRCWGPASREDHDWRAAAAPNMERATAIGAGASWQCALTSGGAVSCWGFWSVPVDRERPVRDLGAGAHAVSGSTNEACAVLDDGHVSCWGPRLLLNDTMDRLASFVPTLVPGIGGATAVTVGNRHACAIVAGGRVMCWGLYRKEPPPIPEEGNNFDGQLGDGTYLDRAGPVFVQRVAGATAIDATRSRTCAVVAGGAVWCWGSTVYARRRDPARVKTPRRVQGLKGASAVAVGDYHTCALVKGGVIKCWGNGGSGELGRGRPFLHELPYQAVPRPVVG